MKEIWKDIVGFEGKYKISNLGNVYSTFLSGLKKQQKTQDGYLRSTFEGKNKRETYLIHRLVALSFLENLNQYKEINHIDGNKENNKVENLEWCDRSRNCQHAYDKGLNPKCYGEKNGRAKLTENQVLEIKQMAYKVSGVKLAKQYNIGNSMIYRIWKNENWSNI